MTKMIDMVGFRVGRLVVVEFAGRTKERRALWRCKCDCGNETVANVTNLRKAVTRSCGCLNRDITIKRNTKHGMATRAETVPEFSVWKDIIRRCSNPNRDDYKYYGGRGISVCERWMDFSNFYADMGKRPDGMTIDRIDTLGNYEPGNCRWITIQEQQNNRRDCVYLEHEGRKLNMKQWARELGISYYAFRNKIKNGNTVADFMSAEAV